MAAPEEISRERLIALVAQRDARIAAQDGQITVLATQVADLLESNERLAEKRPNRRPRGDLPADRVYGFGQGGGQGSGSAGHRIGGVPSAPPGPASMTRPGGPTLRREETASRAPARPNENLRDQIVDFTGDATQHGCSTSPPAVARQHWHDAA